MKEDMLIVKRVIGLPGDALRMHDQLLYVNSVVQDEPCIVMGREPDCMLWRQEILLGGPRERLQAHTR